MGALGLWASNSDTLLSEEMQRSGLYEKLHFGRDWRFAYPALLFATNLCTHCTFASIIGQQVPVCSQCGYVAKASEMR